MERRLTVRTELGELEFAARGVSSHGGAARLDLTQLDCEVELPPGMSVQRTRAVLLRAECSSGFVRLDFDCRLATQAFGGSESGQALDAQSWNLGADLVTVGTEDAAALSSRMPRIGLDGDRSPVTYHSDGFGICLRSVPAGEPVGLHYVIVENVHPEPVDSTSWCAVNIPHASLLAQRSRQELD